MSRKPAEHVLEAIAAQPWAITQDGLDQVVAVAQRALALDVDALEARLGKPLDNTHAVTVRDGVATIPVIGPLFRYANIFTRISGATAFATLARDIRAAVDDPTINAIILEFNTPGGQVDGTLELAALVLEAREVKPVTARVGGMAASGGFWIASAASEIRGLLTSFVGSVGAVIEITDFRAADAEDGVRTYTFVSSVSPKKRVDPATDMGAAEIQRVVDRLGQVFVEAVAANREVPVETVLERYGQGGILVGAEAVAAGMMDGLGTYEQVHAELVKRTRSRTSLFRPGLMREGRMPESTDKKPEGGAPARLTRAQLEEQYGAEVTAIRTEATVAERTRICGIQQLARAGQEDLATAAVNDPSVTPEVFARRVLEAEGQQRKDRLEALQGDEAALAKPTPVGAELTDPQSDAAVAARVLAVHQATTQTRRSA